MNLPPLPGRRAADENSSRRGGDDIDGGTENFLLFERERDPDLDMDAGADIPSAAARQGISTDEWSRRNLYNG